MSIRHLKKKMKKTTLGVTNINLWIYIWNVKSHNIYECKKKDLHVRSQIDWGNEIRTLFIEFLHMTWLQSTIPEQLSRWLLS